MAQGRRALIVLTAAVSTSAVATGYIFLRRFRRRRIQSALLRRGKVSRIDAKTLEPGSYVRLEGTVETPRPLLSPEKHVQCVAYRTVRVRVVDAKVSEKKSSTSATVAMGLGILEALAKVGSLGLGKAKGGRGGVTSSRESTSEQWDVVEQEVSCNAQAAPLYLKDNHRDAGQIRVDTDGAEFFELETVWEAFEPATALVGGASRHTLGFKTVEKVLQVGKRLIVLGEIGRTEVGAGGGAFTLAGGGSGTHSPGSGGSGGGSADSGGSSGTASYEIVAGGSGGGGGGGGAVAAGSATAEAETGAIPVSILAAAAAAASERKGKSPRVAASALPSPPAGELEGEGGEGPRPPSPLRIGEGFREQEEEHEEAELVVHRPVPRHMFDLKTTEILRPFVVSTLPDHQLLAVIEKSARQNLLSALGAFSVGAAAAGGGLTWRRR